MQQKIASSSGRRNDSMGARLAVDGNVMLAGTLRWESICIQESKKGCLERGIYNQWTRLGTVFRNELRPVRRFGPYWLEWKCTLL